MSADVSTEPNEVIRQPPPSITKQLSDVTAQTLGMLGATARLMDNEAEASRCFARALTQNPFCSEAINGIGDLLKSQGQYRQAIELYQRVVDANPKDGNMWAEMAYCFLMINDLHNSYNSYQRALYYNDNPKNSFLWYGIGMLYNSYGNHSHAVEAFHACLKMDPNFKLEHEVQFRIAIIAKKQGKLDQALESLHNVISALNDPSWQSDVWSQIGHVYELKRDVPSAKNSYLKALEFNKNHVKALQQLGWLHYKDEDDFKIAIDYLKRATEIDSRDGLGWYLLGRCYMAAQSHELAYAAYEQAVNADPNNPNVWCSLGVLYYQLEQNRDALEAYTRAIKLDHNLCEVWYNVGTLYDKCNQTADAYFAYKKAADLGATGDFIMQRITALNASLAQSDEMPQRNSSGNLHRITQLQPQQIVNEDNPRLLHSHPLPMSSNNGSLNNSPMLNSIQVNPNAQNDVRMVPKSHVITPQLPLQRR